MNLIYGGAPKQFTKERNEKFSNKKTNKSLAKYRKLPPGSNRANKFEINCKFMKKPAEKIWK